MKVIIPALNEEKSIYNVVSVFHSHPRISQVIVMIDDRTEDNTESEARLAGAKTHRIFGLSGKGQLIQMGVALRFPPAQYLGEERVILSDGDYIRINNHVVEMVTSEQVRGMRIIVPRNPGEIRWKSSGFPHPFDPVAWAVNSGLRNVPLSLIKLQEPELHGYLTETQLNSKAQTEGVPIELIQVDSLIAPLRFTKDRLQAMEEDRQWGIANGVLKSPQQATGD